MSHRAIGRRVVAGLAVVSLGCILPGEPSSADRIVFSFSFTQPYRVPLAISDSMDLHSVSPEIVATVKGERLNNPSYRLQSSNTSIVRVDGSGRRLHGVARGTASVYVVMPTTLGAADTAFDVQVVISGVRFDTLPRLTRLGATGQVHALAFDASGWPVPGVPFTWTSSKPEVAPITSQGVVKAVDEGWTDISAEADGVSGTARLTVLQAAARVQVSPKVDTLRTAGRDRQFQAFAYDSNNARMLPVKILWRSSNPAVATVDTTGRAIAQSAGTARIIAQVGLTADTASLVLSQVLRYVEVTPGLDTLTAIDDTSHLVALGKDTAQISIPGPPSVTWASADTTIATVDPSGLVRARGNGLVLITASSGGQSGSAVVLVKQEVAKARIVEDSVSLTGDGASVHLTAVGVDRNGYPLPPAATRYAWASRFGLVATVDTGGLVTAHGDGRTWVTAQPINGGPGDTAIVIVTGAPQHLIAFDSPQGIELIRTDGTFRTVLVYGYSDYYYDSYLPQDPAWSPDGARVAYAAQYISYYSSNSWSIAVTSADGSVSVEPISNSSFTGDPAWSPDGSRLAFASDAAAGGSSIDMLSATGGSVTRLTNAPSSVYDYNPAWSPDGSKIAFQSNRDGNYEIYVMNVDGSGVTRVTSNPTQDEEPAWSPDGSQLAFVSDRGGVRHVWLMNADGSGATSLTADATGATAEDRSPAWSPDGQQIAFASTCSGCVSDLYIINRDGTGLRRLTTFAAAEHPSWRTTTPLTAAASAARAASGPARRRRPTR